MITADELTKLVDQFPAPDGQEILSGADREAMLGAVDALHEHGRDAVVGLVNMLAGPAQGGDTRPHHVLHALAVSVSAQDTKLRRTVAQSLATTLKDARPTEVKAFIIRQLQVVGGAEVVSVLGRFLTDADLCEPATQALLAIGEGADLFRQALPHAPEACRLTLAQALGVLGDAPSATALLDLLDSPDTDVRLAAVWGLARIAQPATVDAILKAAEAAAGYERIKATQACLLLAENLLAADHTVEGQRVYRHLQQTRTDDAERYVRQAAALGLTGAGVAATGPTAPHGDDGWQVLFDGENLQAWQNARGGQPGEGWVLENGAMVRKQRAGDIWTKERFGDFVLDLEFNTQGNSGVFIRTDRPTDNVQTGIEIQVYNPTERLGTHSCGAVYDCLAPSKNVAKRNEWNRMVVTARDHKISVEMNGQQIIDMDLNHWSKAGKNPDGSNNKFRNAMKDFKREGHIGMQDHGAVVAYRNVKIKSLEAQP